MTGSNKNILVLVAGIMIGYFAYQFINSESVVAESSSQRESVDLQEIREQLQSISDSDLREYLDLKDQKEKYLKANDILAKIMIIFLADLGLRIKDADVQELVSLSESKDNTEEIDDSDIDSLKVSKEKSAKPKEQVLAKAVVPIESTKEDWKKIDKKLSEVRTDSEVEDFLKKVEIKDFFSQITSARLAGRRTLRLMNGVFVGTINYFDPEVETADIYMELDGFMEEGKIKGKNKVILSRHGEAFSNSNGGGDLENYKRITGSKEAHFFQLGGQTGFLQLYFNSNTSAFGNFYKQKSLNQFELAGRVRLNKK